MVEVVVAHSPDVIRAPETNTSALHMEVESVAMLLGVPNPQSADPICAQATEEEDDALSMAATSRLSLLPSFASNMAEERNARMLVAKRLREVALRSVLLTVEEFDAS
jgi:hypothetical protein